MNIRPRDASLPSVELRHSPERGRGVFALVAMEAGTLIETCPVIEIAEEQVAALIQTNLSEYYFAWGGTGDSAAIALGFGSLYNHSAKPNAIYVKKPSQRVIEFISIVAIAAESEILVNYHGGYGDASPVWFEVR